MLFSAVTFVLNNSFSTDKLVSEPELRTRIADDLLNNYELAGKTEEEIIALLGKMILISDILTPITVMCIALVRSGDL